SRAGSQQSKCEWRRHRARSPAGCHWNTARHHTLVRIETSEKEIWSRFGLHWWWSRNRDHSGGGLMSVEGIQKVGVLGCGLMGSGIAQVAATAGYPTVVRDVAEEFLKKGMAGIDKSLSKFVEKGTLTAQQQTQSIGRLKTTTKFEELADCDIVIEAITENLDT